MDLAINFGDNPERRHWFALKSSGIVLLIAGLAAVTFLAESAILDWSALLITSEDIAPAQRERARASASVAPNGHPCGGP